MKALFLILIPVILGMQACSQNASDQALSTAATGAEPLSATTVNQLNNVTLSDTVVKTEAEWKDQLSFAAYRVLREEGTELPFVNEYNKNKKKGIYLCAACGNPLFSSETKFESGTGWPSFYQPIAQKRVKEVPDKSLGMVRTEVECARCGSHIGHVFDDGPEPTGLRYCLNSVSLNFQESK